MSEKLRSAKVRAVLIAGPTASGKSALALDIAERCGGAIVNADSMQVYGDLRIITARPTDEDMRRVPHRLYGQVDAAVTYSTGAWLKDAQQVLAETWDAGRLPVVVGGTGLYFKLLTSGLAAVPAIPADVRDGLRARLKAEGAGALYADLATRDPASAARLHPGDGSRIVRALEVLEATGRPLRLWHDHNAPPVLDPPSAVKVFVAPDRAILRARIDARFDAMLAAGALAEVAALAARGLDPLLPAMKAHGVPWLIRHLRGEIGREQATDGAKADTRRYAKRQFTWARNQLSDWRWLAPETAATMITDALGFTK